MITGKERVLCAFAHKKADRLPGLRRMQKTDKCAIADDMAEVLQKMIDADVIVLASPVYFYSINSQKGTRNYV